MTHAEADEETIEQGNVMPAAQGIAEHVDYWRRRALRAEKREAAYQAMGRKKAAECAMWRAIAETSIEIANEAAPEPEEW